MVGANNAELRFLTVENTGGAAWAVAIFNNNAAPRLTHITAAALGGTNQIGVYNYASSSPAMKNVSASARGGTSAHGIYNASSSPLMKDVTASATEGTSNYGVYNNNSSPTMTDVAASVPWSSWGINNFGVFNDYSSPTMRNVTASASGGTQAAGVNNSNSSLAMTDVTASGSAGYLTYGVVNFNSSVTINTSAISASGGTYELRDPGLLRQRLAPCAGEQLADQRQQQYRRELHWMHHPRRRLAAVTADNLWAKCIAPGCTTRITPSMPASARRSKEDET